MQTTTDRPWSLRKDEEVSEHILSHWMGTVIFKANCEDFMPLWQIQKLKLQVVNAELVSGKADSTSWLHLSEPLPFSSEVPNQSWDLILLLGKEKSSLRVAQYFLLSTDSEYCLSSPGIALLL